MNWKLFIAHRIYKSNEGGKEVSKPAVRIAMAGIAIGLAVMIISVAVVIGFKHQVRDKVVGLSSDILVTSMDEAQSYQTTPVVASDSLLQVLKTVPSVSHVQRYATKPGMIMTSDNFQGMVLKGVAQEYDTDFLKNICWKERCRLSPILYPAMRLLYRNHCRSTFFEGRR